MTKVIICSKGYKLGFPYGCLERVLQEVVWSGIDETNLACRTVHERKLNKNPHQMVKSGQWLVLRCLNSKTKCCGTISYNRKGRPSPPSIYCVQKSGNFLAFLGSFFSLLKLHGRSQS
ncbi:uncharacterized protein BDR25DRAFT_353850 [Lindgomyces ingoldianus]|uniref:Uncharacterized protein n=1 Tax=Lindgomyces ingoldianus TaxID=673940 RepID=A0ACB6QYI4_9PLEO|nr:uncharacterized protein BDR25DRAFT_353850 [Lindgomyces ingoldianus]KAF2472114.1 hypothetical protein BDR25DRAFT_353850 [Lindgomyces ingoldianus]